MAKAVPHCHPLENFLVRSLPADDCRELVGEMERIRVASEQPIYQRGESIEHLYFPITAMLSWIAATETGERVEVGVVGWEGMVGIPVLLGYPISPYTVEVELPGEVLRVRTDEFMKHFECLDSIHDLFFRYTYTALVQLAQSSTCGRFHPIESRLARWLLMAHDRAEGDELRLTQAILADMIGARRPTVSIVGGILQRAGLIRVDRGRVTVLDRAGLEAASCECYGVIRDAFDRFLAR